MDNYTASAEHASRIVTETFSGSFSSAITLLDRSIQQPIYNIYGLVRIADEIVDSYQGVYMEEQLNALEEEVYAATERAFSTNIIVHAFAKTARQYGITPELIAPFFASMRMDIEAHSFSTDEYASYIYGSAEVVGLMCLKVFTHSNDALYEELKAGACALGAAYQKINFLRDMKDDHEIRQRFYFPNTSYEAFDEAAKSVVVYDIQNNLALAVTAANRLPKNSRHATRLSYQYYAALLEKLERTPVASLKEQRLSVSKWTKLGFLLRARAGSYVG